jgi:hypothetical protein
VAKEKDAAADQLFASAKQQAARALELWNQAVKLDPQAKGFSGQAWTMPALSKHGGWNPSDAINGWKKP